MNRPRLVAHSLRTLRRYKLRTAFMMLGSFLGVAALTLVGTIGAGAERKILDTVRQIFGSSSILVAASSGAMMGGPRPASSRLDLDDIEAIAKSIPGITSWDPQQGVRRATLTWKDASTTPRVLGQSEQSERVWGRTATTGQFFDAGDVAALNRVALVGETVARNLFGSTNPIGADIQIQSVPFRVIGVLERFGTDLHGMDRDNEVVVPISTAMRRLTNVDTIDAGKFLIADPSKTEEISRSMTVLLRERHGLVPGQPNDFTILTPIQVQQMVGQAEQIFFVFLPLIAGVSLVAGGVVAAMLMLVSVNERVSEIGLRRAVGARPEDVSLQFLVETTATTLAGGLLGVAVGYLASNALARAFHLGDILSWRMLLVGLIVSSVVGLVAGVLPARRAARLQPIAALR